MSGWTSGDLNAGLLNSARHRHLLFGGFPSMFGVGSEGGFGAMDTMSGFVPESQLAQEYMKLQQDFFKWQQQLLQNQHVLHSRVAPLANNPNMQLPQQPPPQVMRDMMAGTAPPLTQQYSQQAPPPPPLIQEVRKPREVNIPIMLEGEDYSSQDRQSRSRSVPRLSQSVQDGNAHQNNMPQYHLGPSVPNNKMSRWAETPSVSVGAWQERPNMPVGVKQDRDYVQNTPMSRSTQDLYSTGIEPHQKVPANPLLVPRPFVRPAEQCEKPPSDQAPPLWRELQNRRADLGLNQDNDKAENSHNEPQAMHSIPSQFQNSVNGYSIGPYETATVTQPKVYFGQPPADLQQPSFDQHTRNNVINNTSNNERPEDVNARFTSVVTLSNDKPSNGQGPDRMKSIVQLNGSEPQPTQMLPPSQPPVFSQQFQNSNRQNQPNNQQQFRGNIRPVAPVVRGFRQSSEERPSNFQSKIISNVMQPSGRSQSTETSPTTPPQYSEPIIPAAPMSSRLVAAVQAPVSYAPPANASVVDAPSKMESPRTSPSAGPAFANVKLKSVETRYSPPKNIPTRISPPKEVPTRISPPRELYRSQSPAVIQTQQASNIPPPAPPSMVNIPPPPSMVNIPPPPPMSNVPPPPPPPSIGALPLQAPTYSGERRTSSGKKIVSCKPGAGLDPREELMMAIRTFGGSNGGNLKRTH